MTRNLINTMYTDCNLSLNETTLCCLTTQEHINVTSDREMWFIWQTEVSFLCVCTVIDHEFRHNIVRVAVDLQGDKRCYDEIPCQ